VALPCELLMPFPIEPIYVYQCARHKLSHGAHIVDFTAAEQDEIIDHWMTSPRDREDRSLQSQVCDVEPLGTGRR